MHPSRLDISDTTKDIRWNSVVNVHFDDDKIK